MPPRKRLGQLLTELGVVDEHQLQSALGHQKQWGGKLGAILVQKGFCKEEEVVSALSRHLGMPRVRLSEQKVDPRAIKFVARPIAEKLHVFAYEVSGTGRSEVVTIAMSDPTDLSAVDQLAFHTGKRIKPMLAGDSEIVSAIAEHYGADEKPRVAPAAEPPVIAAQPSPAGPSGPFGRRIDPPATRTPPGVPRMTPVMTPVWSPKVAQAAPAGAARPAVDLPPAGPDEDLPLEPIAAHSQTEEVQGQTDFSGTGSAADSVEGLEPAGNAQAAAQENWSGGGGWDAAQSWGAPPEAPSPSQDWGAPPPEPLPDWGDQPAEAAWGAPQHESAEQPAHEAQPPDAAHEEAQPPADAAHEDDHRGDAAHEHDHEHRDDVAYEHEAQPEAAADALPEEAAYEPHSHDTAEEALPEETAYEAEPQGEAQEGSAPEAESADAANGLHAAGEELPVDAILGTAEEAHPAFSASEEPAHAADDSAEAPDAWGATEDPFAAQEAPGWSGGDAAHAAGDAFAEASHDGFEAGGAPEQATPEEPADEQGFDIEESEPAAAEETQPEWGAAESLAAEETAAETVVAGDATVEMQALAQEAAPADQHAEASYAPGAGTYAAADPEARAAEPPTTPVFGMVSPDDGGPTALDAGHAPEPQFEARVAAPEGAEPFEDTSDVPVEWSEPPEPEHTGASPVEFVADDQAEHGHAAHQHHHLDAAAHEHEHEHEHEHLDAAAHEHEHEHRHDAADEPPAEGWAAPADEQGAAWPGEVAGSSGPLSAQDLTTLTSAGIDPHDATAALRLLASLVRALERKGLLDLTELAAEVHESTAQAADAAEDVPPV